MKLHKPRIEEIRVPASELRIHPIAQRRLVPALLKKQPASATFDGEEGRGCQAP